MSNGNWIPAAANETPIPGELYRVRCNIRAPYTAANTALLKATWMAKLASKPYTIEGFKHAAPLYSAHSAELTPWPFIVELRATAEAPVQAGFNPAGLIALALTIVSIAFAVNAIEPKVERFVVNTIKTLGDETRKGLQEVLNPGFIILAAVVAVFFFRAKGGVR